MFFNVIEWPVVLKQMYFKKPFSVGEIYPLENYTMHCGNVSSLSYLTMTERIVNIGSKFHFDH